MSIAKNPIEKECEPRELSESSNEVVTLYERIKEFKEDPEFAARGFAIGGPYISWLQDIRNVKEERKFVVLDELSFVVGDVTMLGLQYVAERGSAPSEQIIDMERRIRTGIALANCDEL